MEVQRSQRLMKLPPYLFADLRRKINEAKKRGVEVISLGIGDPDTPTPDPVVGELVRAVQDAADPNRHRYGIDVPAPQFAASVRDFYRRRWGVTLADEQVVTTNGSKDAIAQLPMAIMDPGDLAVAPAPGYPTYNIGHVFAGGSTHYVPLRAKNRFLVDFDEIPPEVRRSAKILWLNYPNNPTGAVAPREFLAEAVAFARRHRLILAHDAPYSEIAFDGYRPESILNIDGAKEVAIEYHSLSKTYNMTGWRIGFAVGNAQILAGLGRIKQNMDSGVFQAVQYAGIAALSGSQQCVADNCRIWQERRDVLIAALREMGFSVATPKASFYAWVPVPAGFTSSSFCADLLAKAGVVVTPGNGFGAAGEGFARIAFTVNVDRIREAMDRIRKLGIRGD